jgi:hypothetical protein
MRINLCMAGCNITIQLYAYITCNEEQFAK